MYTLYLYNFWILHGKLLLPVFHSALTWAYQRLDTYVKGLLDLRDAYLSPEAENAVFLVTVKKEVITAAKQLQPSEITEDMLPEKDYFFDVDDYIDDDETSIDRYQLDVPSKDKETFSTLISRMGWRVWEIGKSAANVAAVW